MTEGNARCPMCDDDKMCIDHHEHFLDGKIVKMCKPCETLFHRYLQHLGEITKDSSKPFKYEWDEFSALLTLRAFRLTHSKILKHAWIYVSMRNYQVTNHNSCTDYSCQK